MSNQLSIEYLNSCASTIQKTWYNYQDRQIFNLMLTAINVLKQVEPRLIIRRLAPKEWLLLNDKAFNVKVLFKLDGQSFPPTVVYKFVIKNPSEFNINSKVRGGHSTQGVVPRARSNEWRELTIEPLENFLPKNHSYQPSRTMNNMAMHFNSPELVKRPVVIPSTPNTFHMKKNHHRVSRPNTSSTIPAYFSQYINNYFDEGEEETAGGAGDNNIRQNTPKTNFESGDFANVRVKKFIQPEQSNDDHLELEDWAHNLNDDELQF